MVIVKSCSPIGFSRLEALRRSGYTAVESDYAGIAPSTSTLHSKTLAYEVTRAWFDSFEYRVYRLDPRDKDPVNVDLYRLTRAHSFAIFAVSCGAPRDSLVSVSRTACSRIDLSAAVPGRLPLHSGASCPRNSGQLCTTQRWLVVIVRRILLWPPLPRISI